MGVLFFALSFGFSWWVAPGPARQAAPQSKSQPTLTILFFTATWCEPCRAVAPVLEEFARENQKQVKLVAIDFDREKAEVARWHIREIPVVLALSSQGKVLLRFEGADRQGIEALASRLEPLLKPKSERK